MVSLAFQRMLKKGTAAVVLAAAVGVLAGCGGEDETKTHTPSSIGAHDRCHLCGMVIVHYEGPKAQVYIKDIEEPIKFCSGRDAFTFALQPENARRLEAFFIHDMGKTSWAKPSDDAFVDATAAHYVYGHKIPGVMGNEPVAFSDKTAAQAFVEKEGGALYSYADITLQLLEK